MSVIAHIPVPDGRRSDETVGDLLKRLGSVSPDRVRMHPAPGTATIADVVAIEAGENRLFELADGVLVEKCMGYPESLLAARILIALGIWVQPRDLGELSGADGMMRLFPNLVRIPDVAFVSRARLPDGKPPDEPVPAIVPDLAVEVIGESNTDGEMRRKREEYFRAGVPLVWLVNGRSHTITVYTGPEQGTLLREGQILEGGAVLPGFTLALAELFKGIGK